MFGNINQLSDGNQTEIRRPKVIDIYYNIVAPFYITISFIKWINLKINLKYIVVRNESE